MSVWNSLNTILGTITSNKFSVSYHIVHPTSKSCWDFWLPRGIGTIQKCLAKLQSSSKATKSHLAWLKPHVAQFESPLGWLKCSFTWFSICKSPVSPWCSHFNLPAVQLFPLFSHDSPTGNMPLSHVSASSRDLQISVHRFQDRIDQRGFLGFLGGREEVCMANGRCQTSTSLAVFLSMYMLIHFNYWYTD